MSRTMVVMPAFNEAGTIRTIAQRVLAQPIDRLIVIDDGSSDGTATQLRDLDIELLTNPTNQGKGFSLRRGMRHASALGCRHTITIDADGQHQPEDIPRLLGQALRDPHHIVIAARTRKRDQAPPWRRFGNDVADFWISWACGQPVRDSQSGFRLYPASLIARLPLRVRRGAGFVFESEILIDAARRGVGSVDVPIDTRYEETARPSHYRPIRDTWSIVRMVALKLLERGFHPVGLWRVLRARRSNDRSHDLNRVSAQQDRSS